MLIPYQGISRHFEIVRGYQVFLLGNRLVWPKATVFEIVIMGSNPISPARITNRTSVNWDVRQKKIS